MDKGKEDALRTAFRMIIKKTLENTHDMLCPDEKDLVNETANELLKEVTIRTKVA